MRLSMHRFTHLFRRLRQGWLLPALLALAACSAPAGLPASTPTTAPIAATPMAGITAQPATTLPAASPEAAQPLAATQPPAPALILAPAVEASPAATQDGLPATGCTAPLALTPALTEGPYFKPNSPERSSLLEAGMAGTRLVLTGRVLTPDCQPVAHAKLDFWQADAQGRYDNAGYTLRGHLFTGADGSYRMETVIPGEYPGRTEHIHVKVQAPGGQVLTTQLFFPGVAGNQTDGIFDPALIVQMQPEGAGQAARFDFVVAGQ